MPGPGAGATRYIIEKDDGTLFVTIPSAAWVTEEFKGQTVPLSALFTKSQQMLLPGDYSKAFVSAVLNQLKREYPDVLEQQQAAGGETPDGEGITPTDFNDTLAAFASALGEGSEPAEDPIVSQAKSFYRELWGIEPPKGYVERYFKAGGDFFDFRAAELGRPAAKQTQYWKGRGHSYAGALADIFGRGF